MFFYLILIEQFDIVVVYLGYMHASFICLYSLTEIIH